MTTVRREEYPHHTNDQVRGYIDDALAIVRDLGIDDDLKEVAFGKAIDLLSAKSIEVERFQPGAGLLAPRLHG